MNFRFFWLLLAVSAVASVSAATDTQVPNSNCTSQMSRGYILMAADGSFYFSSEPGRFGGYWRGKTKIYGRLDCPSAIRWIKRGHYVRYRVFFATADDAIAAGFRPCKVCHPERG